MTDFDTIQYCINNSIPCFTFPMDFHKKPNISWTKIDKHNFVTYISSEDNGFAIKTGDKYIMVDFDIKENPPDHILELLMANCSAIEKTPGGYHFWYLNDTRTKHFTSKAGIYWDNINISGLDIRAEKGIAYTHPSQYTGADGKPKRYIWIHGNLSCASPIPSIILEHISCDRQEKISERSTIAGDPETNSVSGTTISTQDDIITILGGLSSHRIDNYQSWLSVGMALKNSDYPCELWDEWSRKSTKYKLGVCQNKWRTFGLSERPLTKASLYQWLKVDNYPLFVSLQSANREIEGAFRFGTNAHVADAFYKINPTKYVFSSTEGWYVLQENNTWFQVGSTEANRIPNLFNDIRNDCCDVMYDILKNLSKGREEDSVLHKAFADTLKKIHSSSFLKGVIAFLPGLYYCKDVEKLFNQKRHLFAFTNGVYDMKVMEFRPIEPSDYITVTCGYDYREALEGEKEMVLTFMKTIQPNSDVMNYLLQALSSTLEGENRAETFHALTGMGANGKSCLMDLCQITFGDYYRTIGVSYLTKEDDGKDRPLPDLVAAQWARMLVASEPEEKDRFQVAMLKLIAGGDEIGCRGMYGKVVHKFVPQFKLWIMSNDMPRLSKYDQGIERRMRCLHFPTRFVMTPRAENERIRDDGLKGRIKSEEGWKYGFLALLLEAFSKVRGNSLELPEEVRKFTEDYMLKNNPVGAWLRKHYEITGHREDYIKKGDLYDAFKESYGGDKSRNGFYDDVLKCNILEKKTETTRVFIGLRKREKIIDEE